MAPPTFRAALEVVARHVDTSSALAAANPSGLAADLKVIRLVDKDCSVFMLNSVKGFTLGLNGSGEPLMRQMSLLQGTKLSHLRVDVTPDVNGVLAGALPPLKVHSMQQRCFLLGMGDAIRTVTRLDIDTTSMTTSSPKILASLLSPLAAACPALKHLKLNGYMDSQLLAAFAASCSNLTSLELNGQTLTHLTQQLCQLMPRLTHFQLASPDYTLQISLSMLSGHALTHVDVGEEPITSHLWNALPSLQQLQCGFDWKLVGLHPQEQLNLLVINGRSSPQVWVHDLVAVLQAAPHLDSLDLNGGDEENLSGVGFLRMPGVDTNLAYLQNRVKNGVKATTSQHLGTQRQGLCLYAQDADSDDEGEEDWGYNSVSAMLISLAPAPEFTGLHLYLKAVGDDSAGASFMEGLTAIFPNLTDLNLTTTDWIPADILLLHLAACTSLSHLMLHYADATVNELADLVDGLPSLKVLRLRECLCPGSGNSGFSELQDLLREEGSVVELFD